MMHFSLKYIFLLIFIANECVSKTINQDHLQLKFVFIVSTYQLPYPKIPTNIIIRFVIKITAELCLQATACGLTYQFYT